LKPYGRRFSLAIKLAKVVSLVRVLLIFSNL
jgi:hypothetical protein